MKEGKGGKQDESRCRIIYGESRKISGFRGGYVIGLGNEAIKEN